MNIKTLKKVGNEDIESLAFIHKQVLKESILNRFGYNFLLNLYKIICLDKDNIVQIITTDNKIIGYCVATKDTSRFYKSILFGNYVKLSWEIIINMQGNFRLIINILIWILSTRRNDKYPAELQFLAILPKYQRQGLGTKLIEMLKKEYRQNNIVSFGVATKAGDTRSNNFYKRSGFKYLYQEKILGENFNYYLSKT